MSVGEDTPLLQGKRQSSWQVPSKTTTVAALGGLVVVAVVAAVATGYFTTPAHVAHEGAPYVNFTLHTGCHQLKKPPYDFDFTSDIKAARVVGEHTAFKWNEGISLNQDSPGSWTSGSVSFQHQEWCFVIRNQLDQMLWECGQKPAPLARTERKCTIRSTSSNGFYNRVTKPGVTSYEYVFGLCKTSCSNTTTPMPGGGGGTTGPSDLPAIEPSPPPSPPPPAPATGPSDPCSQCTHYSKMNDLEGGRFYPDGKTLDPLPSGKSCHMQLANETVDYVDYDKDGLLDSDAYADFLWKDTDGATPEEKTCVYWDDKVVEEFGMKEPYTTSKSLKRMYVCFTSATASEDTACGPNVWNKWTDKK